MFGQAYPRAATLLLPMFLATALAACAEDDAKATLAAQAGSEPPAPRTQAAAVQAAARPLVTVYKSPTCGCCAKWVDHMRERGFELAVVDDQQMGMRKAQLGVPQAMASCHTATVGDYVIEGHVPAQDVLRRLREEPDAAGLAVRGMPIGSPGMEVGDRIDPYTLWLYHEEDDRTAAWARHGIASGGSGHGPNRDQHYPQQHDS